MAAGPGGRVLTEGKAVVSVHLRPPLPTSALEWVRQTGTVSEVRRHLESNLTPFPSLLNILMIQRIATHSISRS